MPNQLIKYYPTPEELAEILQLQAKVRAMVNNIHYPLRNLLALLSMRYITYCALTYIPYVPELMWELSYKLFDGLITYKAGLFDPIDLKNGVVDGFNKMSVANLNLRAVNVEQLEVFCQILINSFTAKEIQLLLSKPAFLNEGTYANNKLTKILLAISRTVRMKK